MKLDGSENDCIHGILADSRQYRSGFTSETAKLDNKTGDDGYDPLTKDEADLEGGNSNR